MSTFYEIAGAVLPPLVGCALAAFSVGLLALGLRGIADAFLESRRIRAARVVANKMRARAESLRGWNPGSSFSVRAVASELFGFARDLDDALDGRRAEK